MNEELLKDYVRPVREEDRSVLPVFSYSKIDTYKGCPYQFDLKYNQKKFTNETSISLELGSLLHYILEQKGKMLVKNTDNTSDFPVVDYQLLNDLMQKGVTDTDEKTKERLLGINDLKKKYFEIWYEKDNASGMTYEDKMQVFDKVLHKEMKEDDNGWKPYLFEHPFEFVWNDRVILKGFIDRVDRRGDDFKTLDYKTSKKVYDSSKLATSLQFGIYALAILNEFGVLPEESIYRFVLLDETQKALTKGWEKRLIKALNGIFDKIDVDEKAGVYKPSPSPLCHWCNFCSHNPNAKEYKHDCEYYSLWEPNNKTFAVNRQFEAGDLKNDSNSTKLNATNERNKERKLIF